jgi:leucyl aminopeptidase
LVNISGTRYGGASTAAAFLEAFVDKTPWAHIDIAGVAKPIKAKDYETEGSANGYGVRLLIKFLENK